MIGVDALAGGTPQQPPAPADTTNANYGPTSKRKGQRDSPFAQNHVVTVDDETSTAIVIPDAGDNSQCTAGTA